MSFFDRISEGLTRTRERFTEQLNVIFDRGPEIDADFWDSLEETLILGDFGGPATLDIIEQLQDAALRLALPDGYAVFDRLADTIAAMFKQTDADPFEQQPVCVLFVGINGAGKTTTVGKLAKDGMDRGRKVLLGSADTFRAAAIEQLDIWADRAQVPVVKRVRGADPASVSFEVIEKAEASGADLVLIDTAGRLHTSDDLMRELEKVVKVTRKRAEGSYPVRVVLVLDATTGQNGLQQAREFNRALALDGVIITKLDGTAKGGIAVAVSHELELPVLRIGVGEHIEDLKPFDPQDFARALIGDIRTHRN
ncbi:MAG: signal recognition particle-docking protein FtsY [Coriobacteriales bacterium]|jgi:fused signal recognition particle receptor|nr:signal recognition particle-docking protein FtsY [Coriobacteriales bacterium]